MTTKTILSLVMVILLQGCSYSFGKIQYKALPFTGFTVYPKPLQLKIQVKTNCYQAIVLDSKPTNLKIGDCTNKEDVISLVTKIDILETIIDNYEQDIEDYNNIFKEMK